MSGVAAQCVDNTQRLNDSADSCACLPLSGKTFARSPKGLITRTIEVDGENLCASLMALPCLASRRGIWALCWCWATYYLAGLAGCCASPLAALFMASGLQALALAWRALHLPRAIAAPQMGRRRFCPSCSVGHIAAVGAAVSVIPLRFEALGDVVSG